MAMATQVTVDPNVTCIHLRSRHDACTGYEPSGSQLRLTFGAATCSFRLTFGVITLSVWLITIHLRTPAQVMSNTKREIASQVNPNEQVMTPASTSGYGPIIPTQVTKPAGFAPAGRNWTRLVGKGFGFFFFVVVFRFSGFGFHGFRTWMNATTGWSTRISLGQISTVT